MLRVGLTGGLACGKSFVGEALRDLGCLLIQADVLGHEALLPGGAAYPGVLAEFGREILTGDGIIDRKALAAL
ncbi:MAG: dephospho-CoA kinase, partial [Acidobacteriota bacterium]|nr:dephospho-CoA kinase [Acidobacteriota bacterium]